MPMRRNGRRDENPIKSQTTIRQRKEILHQGPWPSRDIIPMQEDIQRRKTDVMPRTI
jgi:hypothetical protein